MKHHQRWKVELQGQLVDLKDVAEAAPGLGATIGQEEDRWFLQAPSFETLATYTEVYDEAERILGDLTAVVTAEYGNSEPITLGGIFDQHTAGTPHAVLKQATVLIAGKSRVYVPTVAGGSGAAQPASEPTRLKRARLYDTDPEVRKAVDFLNTPGDTFAFLYNAYEIVRDDLGGPKSGPAEVARIAGVSLSDLNDFHENASSEALSGDKARHAGASKRQRPPKTSRKMDLDREARPLIRRAVLAWIDYKANRAGHP